MPTQQHINWQRLIFWSFSYLSLVGSSVISYGNPVEPTVVRGAADFSNPAAGHLLIDQHTQRAVIDWPSFNIDAGELTEFRMPSSDSVSLNRVSGTGQSLIDGRLTSNGNLFLLNPNGVIIGQNSRIDVGGFVASSLNLDNDQFMAAGQLNFHGDSKAPVINLGRIGASTGDIILIAPQVTNEGSLMAPNGRVGLAAGNDVLLKVDGSERLFVRSASTKGGVINKGVIEANIAELKAHDGNVYGMAIQNEGRINAKSINREGGKIYLRSGSGKISNKGSLEAKGGDVRIDAGPAGEVEVAGTLDTTSDIARGGSITITGGTISLAADSLVIANGLFGGGEIKIGGGRRGQDPNLQNAVNVTVAEGATITANATLQGDGGNVVLFAEDALAFGGRISADGGLQGGDGGFIELSGQNEIFINQLIGKISLKAATGGKAGTLLIDPNDISIVMGGGLPIPGSPVNSNTIFDFDISDFLENTGSLIVETTGFGGSGNIDIDFMAFIFWTSSNSLTFNADGNFTNNGFIQSQSGAITVNTIGNGNITLGGSITSNASTVTLNAGGLGSITSMSGGFIGANAISLTAGSLGTLFNPLFLDTSDIVTNTSSQNGDQFLITGMNTALGAAGLNAGNGTIHLLGGDFYATGNERIADNSSLHIDGGSLYFSAITETLAAFSITGGNVDAGSANLNVSGPFSVTGAFFHGRDSTLNLEGDLTISSGFFASNSTVSLIGSSNQTLSGPGTLANLNIAKLGGDVVLANDYILGGGSLTGSGAIRGPGQLSIQGNQSIDFAGTIDALEFNQGANTTTLVQDLSVLNISINNTGGIIGSGGPRSLNVSGDVFNAVTNLSMTDASLTLNGSANQFLSGPGILANLNIAKNSGDVVVQVGNFKLGGGSLTGGGTIRGPGRLEIVGNQSIDFAGTIDDLEFNQGATTTTLVQDLVVLNLTINNTGGIIGSGGPRNLNVSGNVFNADTNFSMANASLTLDGISDQFLSGPGTMANLNIAKTGGDVVVQFGNFKLGGGSLTGGGLIRGPGRLEIVGNQSIDFAGTIKELEFNQGANTTTLVQDLAVLNLTINNTGGIIGSGGPRNLNVSGNVFNADTNFSMANASLTLDGISDQLLSGPGSLANLNIAKISGDVVVQFGNFKLGGGSLTGSGAIRGPGRLEIVGNQSIDFSGTIDDLEFNQGATTTLIQDLNITDTLTITNAGAIDGSGGLRRLNVSGDILSNDSSFGMTNATFALTGERVNSFTATAGGNQGSLIIDKLTPSDVAFIGSNITFNSVTIDQGILDLNSRTLNSPVNVNAGGTLGGSGTVGNVIVAAGGTLSPGNSPGLINTGNLTFGSGGAFNADINGSTTAGVDFDRVNVTGSLNLGGATFSTFGNVGPGGSITIISNNGTDAVTDTFSGLAENAIVTINSNDFRINYAGGDGNDVVLFRQNVVPITPVIITTATNTTADTLNFPIGSPSTTVGGGGSNPPPTTVVTNNFSSTSGTGSSSGGGASSPSISAVQLITQITTPTTITTTITTTIATTELQPGTVVGEGTPSSGGGLATSNDSVAPATSVTASSTGSEPQKAVSLGGGPPASTQLQGEMTQSTNAESQNELRLSLGLPPGANVNSSEGSLDTGLGGAAPNRQTEAFLGSSVSDSSFVELAVAAGLNPAVSVQNSDGSGPMQLGAPPATQETSQALSDATSPAAEQGLSLALGGDGTAPTSAGDGTASVGIAVSQPRPETEVSLQSNISSGSASELSQALGGSGETTALPGSGPLTLDADGKPPSEQTTESLQTATSAQEESELFQSLGLAAGGVAQPTDGPLSTDFSDQKASPQTAQTLQTNTNEATRVELSDTIYEASIEAGAPVTDPQ